MGSTVHSIILRAAATAVMLACVATTVRAQSEATIMGQAVAAADGSALPGASIRVKSVSTGDVREVPLDASGRFIMQQVTPGTYVLSGSAEGFAPRELQIELEPREIKRVTVGLDVSRLEVNVEVTAEASRIMSTHSPSSTILANEQLQTLPATQQANLTDAIATAAPGMIRGHDDFVHIRGHEVALNPVINGVSFWENPHFLLSPGLSPLVVETANVMTGGFPAEYGNRFGGVIDIVTKSGLRMQHDGFLAATGGQAGRGNATGEIGGHRGRFGYYVFGSMFTSDRFLSPPDPTAIHDSGRGAHGFVQLDANLGGSGALRIVLMGDGVDFEVPKTPLDVVQRPLATAEERNRQQTSIVGWTKASSNLAIGASFYQRWSTSRLSPATGPLTAVAAFDRGLLTIGGKADMTRFAGGHAIKAGIDAVRLRPDEALSYDYSGYRNLTHVREWPHIHFTGTVNFVDRQSGGQVSAYLQDGIQLGDRVSADLGVRLDRFSLVTEATHASPRVNLAFRVGANVVVHASYNHFFMPPPIEGILTSSAGLTQSIREIGVALPALEPTTEHQVELGASGMAGPLRLALTGYYRSSDNPVHTTVWPDSRIYSYASFDRERAHGLEARAEVPSLSRYGVTGYLNYALGRVNFYNPVTGGFVTEAGHITETSRFLAPMDQTHTLTSGLTYRHARSGTWAGTILEYGSGTPMGHGGGAHEHAAGEAAHEDAVSIGGAPRVPGHFTANLSFGIDLLRRGNARGKLSVQLDIENLTDNVYLIAQEGEFSPSQYSIPRLVSVMARYRF
jgi:hypothetical protein